MSKHVLNTRLCRRASTNWRGAHGRLAHRSEAWAAATVAPRAVDDGMTMDHGQSALEGLDGAAIEFAADGQFAEPAVLDTLYREESPRLLRSLARRTSSREEARDLVQEIFYRVARLGADKLELLDRPQAYLSRMATNLLRDRAKQAWRRNSDSHVSADDVTLVGIDQQRLLESRDMLARVEAAVMRLRPRTREIFLAHRVEGLTYGEIAQRTGLSVKGVEKQMSRAISAIDRLIEQDRA